MFRNPQTVITAIFVVLTALSMAPDAWALDRLDLDRSFSSAARKTPLSTDVKMCLRKCRVQLKELRRECEIYKNRQDHNDMNKQSAGIAFGRCMGKARKTNKPCKSLCQ